MLLTNHVLTGTLLGLTIDNEYILAPTAVASHFALDSLPHFGVDSWKGFTNWKFLILGSVDFTLACSVVVTACIMWPHRIGHILTGAIGAASPDLFYIPEILFKIRLDKLWRPFHSRIQWGEFPGGIIVEMAWATMIIYFMSGLLK